jgi:hypothetical protein
MPSSKSFDEPTEGRRRSPLFLAEYVEGCPKCCYRTDECIRVPSGKWLVVTVEAQAGSPELKAHLSLLCAKWYFRGIRPKMPHVRRKNSQAADEARMSPRMSHDGAMKLRKITLKLF